MGIGKRLYPPDEISAKPLDQAVVKFLGECRWQAGPPVEWRREHDRSLRATALSTLVDLPTLIRNRPVPRTAGGWYIGVDNGPSTIYFY